MEEVLEFKCPSCGNRLFSKDAVDGLVECGFCGEKRAVPRKDNSPAALSFLRMGEHDLDNGKFSDAFSAYSKAAELSPNEPEAYFGMALSGMQVRYIKDEVNGRMQPICYENSAKKFVDDEHYSKALKAATLSQRKEYQKRAEEIDYIKQQFNAMKQSGLDYDCFLCVKVTDENGEKTEDYKDAGYIYDLLKRNSYKPFFSERDIRNKQGADYEAMILYALHTSETMLVVCRNEKYLQTRWVKNEYARFIKLTGDGEKDCDSITVVYYATPIDKLGGKKGKVQGIDFSLREADGLILKFVEEHTIEAKKRKEEEERQKAAREEEIRKQIEEAKQAQLQLEERLKNLQAPSAQKSADATINSLFERGKIELSNADFNKAEGYYNRVLDVDPKFAEGWWGLFLCEFKVAQEDKLLTLNTLTRELVSKIRKSKSLQRAEEFALGEFRERVNKFRKEFEELVSPRSLYDYADGALKASAFHNAADFYKWALEIKPDYAEAWWGLLLTDYSCISNEKLLRKIQEAGSKTPKTYAILFEIRNNENFKNAEKFAAGNLKSAIGTLKTDVSNKIAELSGDVIFEAKDFYIKALEFDRRNAHANYALLLMKCGCSLQSEIIRNINAANCDKQSIQMITDIEYNEHFVGAKKYAEGEMKEKISQIDTALSSKKSELRKEVLNSCQKIDEENEKLCVALNELSVYERVPDAPEITLYWKNMDGKWRVWNLVCAVVFFAICCCLILTGVLTYYWALLLLFIGILIVPLINLLTYPFRKAKFTRNTSKHELYLETQQTYQKICKTKNSFLELKQITENW